MTITDNRDDRLACDVTTHDQGLHAIEPGGIDELHPAFLGSMNIATKEDSKVLSHAIPSRKGRPPTGDHQRATTTGDHEGRPYYATNDAAPQARPLWSPVVVAL